MANDSLKSSINRLRNEGQSWAEIARNTVNPTTGNPYDYRTIKSWVYDDIEPRFEPEYEEDYWEWGDEDEDDIIGGGGEITEWNLMYKSAGIMEAFDSFYEGQLPEHYAENGHLKVRVLTRYYSANPDIPSYDEPRTFTTTNNYNYPYQAAPEMQLILNKMWGKWDGNEGKTGSLKPQLTAIVLDDNLEGIDEDGKAFNTYGEFVWKSGGYN